MAQASSVLSASRLTRASCISVALHRCLRICGWIVDRRSRRTRGLATRMRVLRLLEERERIASEVASRRLVIGECSYKPLAHLLQGGLWHFLGLELDGASERLDQLASGPAV